MKQPYELSKIPAIVIVRKRNNEAVMNRLGCIFDNLHSVITNYDFPSGSTEFQLDVHINHQRALQLGLAMNRPFIVLEEDAYQTKYFRNQIPSQWSGILKMDLNKQKPKRCPKHWAEEVWPGIFRCFSMWSCGSYMINDISQGKELLQEFRDETDLAADEVFIKMMKKLNFYILEEPYFYHGPATNLKSKRTNVCLSEVEKEWGAAGRLSFSPNQTLDDELDNWRNPVVKKGNESFHTLVPPTPANPAELAAFLTEQLGVDVEANSLLHINYTDKVEAAQHLRAAETAQAFGKLFPMEAPDMLKAPEQVMQPELPNFTHSLGENNENS